MKVLVCGGRTFGDVSDLEYVKAGDLEYEARRAEREFVCDTLTRLSNERGPITEVIEGGAKGADTCGYGWALLHRIPVKTFNAKWDEHGRKAGHLRNQQMLDEGKPDLVVAFPGGMGTYDMVTKARKAGVEVVAIQYTNNEKDINTIRDPVAAPPGLYTER